MAPGQWASSVKPPARVICCWNWPGPHHITRETDHTYAPSGWRESAREGRSVPTGESANWNKLVYRSSWVWLTFPYIHAQFVVVPVAFFYSFRFILSSIRHEKPTDPDDPLADQNIKDRYYGINDPVADKLLKRASTMPRLDPPDDKSISTLYIGGLGDTVTDGDLK